MAEEVSQDVVLSARKKLWSDSEDERVSGMEHLRRAGSAAIAPLVSLLNDLITNQHPRFPLGKEEIGSRALNKFIQSVQTEEETGEDEAALRLLSQLAINRRLRSDTIRILGELKAEEAVPTLIRILEGIPLDKGIGDESKALCDIGSAAIPYLIAEVEGARERLVTSETVVPSATIIIDLENDADDSQNFPVETDQDIEEELKVRTIALQKRCVRILGKIGDPSILGFLRGLQTRVGDRSLLQSIQEAIYRIDPNELEINQQNTQPQIREASTEPW